MAKKIWIVLAIGVLVSGCVSPDRSAYMRDGVQYGVTAGTFRGRWWSFYERGTSFARGGFHDEAISDFETALINRSRDSWRARTYGLHFVPYFPNRELGVAYYHQGRYEEAAKVLEAALDMVDTARAHHYLGLTRRALIAQGLLDDTDRPTVHADIAPDTLFTEHVVPLHITAADDTGVAEVRLNDRPLAQRSPRDSVTFRERLHLSEGTHEIALDVVDLADKTYRHTRTVTVDLTGPTIGLFAPVEAEVVNAATVLIEGVGVDDHGMAEITLNDRVIASGTGEKRLPFHMEASLAPGENQLVLCARDQAGNETYTTISIYRGDSDTAAARLWLLQQRAPERLVLARADTGILLAGAPEPEDRIVLRSPRSDRPNRHNRAVRVAGEVMTSAGVARIHINDEPFEQLAGAPKEVFSRRVPIDDPVLLETGGNMTVTVSAQDNAGKHLEEHVEVELRPIVWNESASRMPVAVLAFEGHHMDAAGTEYLQRHMYSVLGQRQRFSLLDRDYLENLLTEHELSAALSNRDAALQAGRIIPVHMFLVGDVFDRGESGIEIFLTVVNTETSEIVSVLDGFAPDQSREALEAACAVLSAELERLFPRLSGELVAVRGSDVFFDWTVDDGIIPGMYALVVHEIPGYYDETFGVYIDAEVERVGRARLEAVLDNISRARPVDLYVEGIELEQGMAAITM